MIILQLTRSQLDTLESDPKIGYHYPIQCAACRRGLDIYLVKLGSLQDRRLTQRTTGPVNWVVDQLQRALAGGAPTTKIVRVRLKAPQCAALHAGQPLTASSACPYCRQALSIRFNIA